MFTATCSCKIKKVLANIEINLLSSDVYWFLSMWNTSLQETGIKTSIRFWVKSYNELKMTDMMVYIKCGLLLKVIIN